jgi:hypothetical protein
MYPMPAFPAARAAARMHQSAVTDWRKHGWKSQVGFQYLCAQFAIPNCDSLLWSECHLFECFTILTERNLIFSTTIHVVEYRFRQAPLCKSQQVIYVHDSR